MDINLKKITRNNLNLKILLLSILVALTPVLYTYLFNSLQFKSMYERFDVSDYYNEFYNGLVEVSDIYEDIDGNINEEGIQKYLEINNTNTTLEGKNKEELINVINSKYNNFFYKFVKNSNFEFFVDRLDKNPFTTSTYTNIKDFLEDSRDGYDYVVLFGTNSSNQQGTEVSKSMKPLAGYNGFRSKYDVCIRVPHNMDKRDTLYYAKEDIESNKNLVKLYGGLLAIDCMLAIGLFINILKNKNKTFNNNIFIKLYGRFFTELKLIFLILLGVFLDYICWETQWYFSGRIIVLIIIAGLLLYLNLAYIFKLIFIDKDNASKELKNKSFLLKIYKSVLKLFDLIRENFVYKHTAIIVISFICGIVVFVGIACFMTFPLSYWLYEPFYSALVVVFILMAIGVIGYVLVIGKEVNKLKKTTSNIVKGNYQNELLVSGPHILREISKDLSNIQEGLESAIDNAVKSERMKGELITNVSHDLKTPLTSIINYVDLLSKDNISNEDREKYIGVLKEKSQRLKVLIEDLFEASKAASGAIELDIVELDPVALLRQTIGELEDKIESSNLQIIKNIPEEKLLILADGKKTFRVFQNLLSNIIKYSMKGSRVYIDVEQDEEYVNIIFKNISESQLNVEAEELMERFKRGDVSRTTEGSGLGLSIAKSLVELQGGEFEIEIDGDLFKAIVRLKKIRDSI
ncbi:sensor histidine kinase [Clostridium paraputrificum]|uniref:sensor histidine kinase n=1 Tax=Clostridium paraputrificum TaxID=29363 RepID=UPI00325B4068